ncbi:alpha/beta hydrolase [Microbacterium sp. NPDC055683]
MRRAIAGRAGAAALTAALVGTAIAGCSSPSDPTIPVDFAELADDAGSGIATENDIAYREVEGDRLQMNACLPAQSEQTAPAVLLLHGGGFTQGARTDESVAGLCVWLAESGYAAFSASYRLAPEHIFPAQVDDVAAAVAFLRDPETAERFAIDPTAIGVLGSSAGAILALETATTGEGALDAGSRVRAAVALSGVADMRPQAASLGEPTEQSAQIILDYLGCTELASCDGTAASAIASVDPSDPAVFLAGSTREIVPVEQSQAMADALTAADVPNELHVAPGEAHGAALMDGDMRTSVLSFLRSFLGEPTTPSPTSSSPE